MVKKIRVHKTFTYNHIIKEAIQSMTDNKATSGQIFDYVSEKHPDLFNNENSTTWKGNIRQLLSKSTEFVKLKKDQHTKLHYWTYIPISEQHMLENIPNKVRKKQPAYINNIPMYQMPIFYNNYNPNDPSHMIPQNTYQYNYPTYPINYTIDELYQRNYYPFYEDSILNRFNENENNEENNE
ncbi:hypothetical protein CWI38_2622p0010 [Hamiltosporidium tvaerminnensis]|uniref:Fork-head domain-containing protein n=5 Tax=Hamiltosporidium TaxID=1176354 RepID=A0A4Q9LF03_9MICR|nr:hypothetical protein CWI38_2622p0010 [Hamiltosporidium tvaerminnensis]